MKKITIYIFLIVAGFTLNSCESFIDLSPLDKISTEEYWYASSDLENYVVQFYPNPHCSSF